jgi:elongation factor 1-alpha
MTKEIDKLPPEVESGNIEYKLKIVPDDDFRLDQLASQMKWRIDEGGGIAIYYLGISDNGEISGINKSDYSQSMKNISKITKKINANITKMEHKIHTDPNTNNKYWHIITVEYELEDIYNARIIFIGPTNSGKTTLISNIVNNMTDDGNGRSRKLVFNHKHEIYSGTTSSVSIERKKIICNDKPISINFIDTPGDKKYIKTTICALCKYDSQMIILCIDPLNINLDELDFFLKILKYFKITFLIIFTKKDKYKSFHRTCLLKNILELVGKEYNTENSRFIPFIEISNITKTGYRKLLKSIKKINIKETNKSNCKFQICDIIKIPNIGKVYTGILLDGILEKDNKYLLINSESTNEIFIESIFFLDKPYDNIEKNQLVTIRLSIDEDICNKTDKLIVKKNINKYSKLIIKCKNNILINTGICIYNNQYYIVNIKNIENNKYEIIRDDGFINVSDKIILKVNDEYYFTNLVNKI